MKVRKVGEGAYFVQSYSEQTVIPFQPTIAAQTVTASELKGEDTAETRTDAEDGLTDQDVKRVLKRTSGKGRNDCVGRDCF